MDEVLQYSWVSFSFGRVLLVLSRRSYTQCCNVCYPLLLFIILAACVMACAGLIWMQIALKQDLDSLKEKLHISKTLLLYNLHQITLFDSDVYGPGYAVIHG